MPCPGDNFSTPCVDDTITAAAETLFPDPGTPLQLVHHDDVANAVALVAVGDRRRTRRVIRCAASIRAIRAVNHLRTSGNRFWPNAFEGTAAEVLPVCARSTSSAASPALVSAPIEGLSRRLVKCRECRAMTGRRPTLRGDYGRPYA
jgi:hypothetical protein